MLKAKVKVNLNFPKFNFQSQLQHIADKVIIPDIQGRMDGEKDINGRSYRALSTKTVNRKIKYGLRTEVLHATGQLRKSFKARKHGNNSVVISPKGMRRTARGRGTKVISNQELADILQNQGVRSSHGKRYFKFFGISKEAEIEAMDFMNKYIKKAIRDGGRKIIR